MADASKVNTNTPIRPMIYGFVTPGVTYHEGWMKIGYTEKQTVEERVKEIVGTAGLHVDLKRDIVLKGPAMYDDGSYEFFSDHEFHRFLTNYKHIEREAATDVNQRAEYFKIDSKTANDYFTEFKRREIPEFENNGEYNLRPKQAEAVQYTKEYFEDGGTEYLWNAKPRFGKTLTAYDLIRQMKLKKVLIVTNRPSIANSWYDDFKEYIGWRGDYCFVSDVEDLKDEPGVLTREQYTTMPNARDKGMIAFVSLQDLKGSVYFGGKFRKLGWIAKEYKDAYGEIQNGLHFDLLIVDESQEGVDTMRTDRAFENINRDHTLYLSGTPFKALASGQFSKKQIFNWTYADEQDAKENWAGEDFNPYEEMPKLNLFTYKMSDMIYDKVKQGADLEDEGKVDYAFDLNEFFDTYENGKFKHEEEVKKFLYALSTQEKYPFSTPELRSELPHTLWLLNRVASVKALAKLLKEDPVFSEYHIIQAAGDVSKDPDENEKKALDIVQKDVEKYEKTITLSVGQLTVGVTVKPWSGVLMLCNMQSPSSYMQAAFRAQNPYSFTGADGKRYRKENAYVFDFDPARTLTIYDAFANNLSLATVNGQGTGDVRKENIKKLLNFFPVIGEDSEGKMVPLDATQVLTIPVKLKSQEVVRHGFMSNFLFQNISNVFAAPQIVQEIVNKLTPAQEGKLPRNRQNISGMEDVTVDGEGNAEVSDEIVIGKTQDLFGEKIYEDMREDIEPQLNALENSSVDELDKQFNNLINTLKEDLNHKVIEPVAEEYGVKPKRMENQVAHEIENDFGKIYSDYKQQVNIANAEHESRLNEVETKEELAAADKAYESTMQDATNSFMQAYQDYFKSKIDNKPKELVEQMEQNNAEKEKNTIEDKVRDHLRGFSRTIPSFLMAYEDKNITLANIDDYTDDDVFEEVTGITEADFRFLRDGGNYTDPETGEEEYFEGHLFDEVVFNDSIQEFFNKKEELANYFDESHTEDIFDYIPPQKTNQIYTPRWVVKLMVDKLEENNPGCFDDPTATFADLYMKSGLYITEIVKRLFNSEKIKGIIPDDNERIRHILREQVYGMAPTEIIYRISTNYILGFDETLKNETKNFAQADAMAAAKEGKLEELVTRYFG